MTRLALLGLLLLAACSGAEDPNHFRAALAPFCIFNCVISVTYAPGVESLDTGTQITTPHRRPDQ